MVAAGMKPIMPPEPEVDPKAKKAPKPKAGDPPPPPKLLEAWTGPHHVFVVEVGRAAARVLEVGKATAHTPGTVSALRRSLLSTLANEFQNVGVGGHACRAVPEFHGKT
eukprot:scaffold74424_cov17-Tisochrysis_lutea.AAC.1